MLKSTCEFIIAVRFYRYSIDKINKNKIKQLHVVSRTQQGWQREPNVKTLRSTLSAEFWRHCVLNLKSQRRALASTPERRNGNIINLNKFSSS